MDRLYPLTPPSTGERLGFWYFVPERSVCEIQTVDGKMRDRTRLDDDEKGVTTITPLGGTKLFPPNAIRL